MMHSKYPRPLAGLVASTVLIALAGCEGGPSVSSADASKAPATVSGTITINGKLASEGKVSFDPANVSRKDAVATTVDIGKDGTYKVTTLAGENQVSVQTPDIQSDPKLNNGQTRFKAQPGDNTFNIVFPPPEGQ